MGPKFFEVDGFTRFCGFLTRESKKSNVVLMGNIFSLGLLCKIVFIFSKLKKRDFFDMFMKVRNQGSFHQLFLDGKYIGILLGSLKNNLDKIILFATLMNMSKRSFK